MAKHDHTGSPTLTLSDPTHRRRRLPLWIGAFVLPMILATVNVSWVQAAAVTYDDVSLSLVPSAGTSSLQAADPTGKDYDEIATLVGTSDSTAYGSEIVILPEGMMTVPMASAQVQLSHAPDDTEDGPRSISIIGMSSFSDDTAQEIEQVEILAVMTWTSAADTAPATFVVFKTSSDMLSNWMPVPTGQDPSLSQALLAMRRPASSGDTANRLFKVLDLTPAAQAFLSDDVDSTIDDISIRPTNFTEVTAVLNPPVDGPEVAYGVTFRAVLDVEGDTADALLQLGLSDAVRFDGEISVGALDKYACSSTPGEATQSCKFKKKPKAKLAGGVDLSATIGLDQRLSTMPDEIVPGAGWTFGIAGRAGQSAVELSIGGDVSVDIAGDPVVFGLDVVLVRDGMQGLSSVTVTGSAQSVDNLFDVDWLDLSAVKLSFAFESVTKTGRNDLITSGTRETDASARKYTIAAQVALGSISSDLDGTFATVGFEIIRATADPANPDLPGERGYSIFVDTGKDVLGQQQEVVISAADLFGANSGATDVDVTIINPSIGIQWLSRHVGGAESGFVKTTTITVETTAALELGAGSTNPATFSTDLFLWHEKRSDSREAAPTKRWFLDLAGSDQATATIGGIIGQDLGDADFTLPSFSISVASDDIFIVSNDLDPVARDWLTDRTGVDDSPLRVNKGANLSASLPLDGFLRDMIQELGIDSTDDLRLVGAVPIMGGTGLSLTVDLPAFGPDQDPTTSPLFTSGDLDLSFGRRTVEGGTQPEVFFSILGTLTASIEDKDGNNDDVAFNVTGELVKTKKDFTGAVDLAIAATDGSWEEAFGFESLTLDQFRLKIEFGGKLTGLDVSVGMLADLAITDDNGETTSYAVAGKVTAGSSGLVPSGFTFGASSLDLGGLVSLHNAFQPQSQQITAPADMPNLWIEDLWFAFGLETDTQLCIRQGIFMTGSLHVGGPDDGPTPGDGPSCEAGGLAIPTSAPLPSETCSATDTCLASVLIDIFVGTGLDTVADSRLLVDGFLAGSHLGPIEVFDTQVQLLLSKDAQRLYLAGGMRLSNPFHDPADAASPDQLFRGSYEVDLGSRLISLTGDVQFGDDDAGLGAYVSGSATPVYGDPLTAMTFDLDIQLRTEALEALAVAVEDGFNDLADAAEELGVVIDEAASDTVDDIDDVLDEVDAAFDRLGADIDRTALDVVLDASSAFSTFSRDIDKAIKTIEGWYEIPIAGPIVKAIAAPVLRTMKATIDEINDAILYGIEFPDITITDVVTFKIPDIPGACDDARAEDHPVCALGRGATAVEIVDEFVSVAFEDVAEAVDLDLDQITSAAATAPELFNLQALSSESSATSVSALISGLSDAFDAEGTDIGCASTSIVGATFGNVPDYAPLAIGAGVNGAEVEFGSAIDLAAGDYANGGQTLTDGVAALLDSPTAAECVTPPAPTVAPSVTIDFANLGADGRAAEGDTVTITGTAPAGSTVTVTIGGSVVGVAAADPAGGWSLDYAAVDDGTVLVTAEASGPNGQGIAVSRLRIANVAPSITATSISTSDPTGRVEEGDEVTLTISFSDPGILDDHDISVRWSDGTSSRVGGIAPQTGTIDVTHTYQDEGADGASSLAGGARVVLTDKDGGQVSESVELTVHNVAPTIRSIQLISIEGCASDCEGRVDDDGQPANDPAANRLEEGLVGTWHVEVDDPGVLDVITLDIDWGDGTTEQIGAANLVSENLARTRVFQITHVYLDEGDGTGVAAPTVSTSGDADVTVGAIDDDTGAAADVIETMTVFNDLPVVVDVSATSVNGVPVEGSPTRFDEMDAVTFEITIHDQGVLDDVDVAVDFGTLGLAWGADTVVSFPAPGAPAEPVDTDGDGIVDLFYPLVHERTATFTYTWEDDAGEDDGALGATPSPVEDFDLVAVPTDEDGESGGADTTLVLIDDVAPVISTWQIEAPGPVVSESDNGAAHVENRADVEVAVTWSDVSPHDSHAVVVDWGSGWEPISVDRVAPIDGSVIDVRPFEERWTSVAVADATTTGVDQPTLTFVNRYGDNGSYPITVTVVDDDSLLDTATATLDVANEAPIHGIDRDAAIAAGDAFVTPGGTTWFTDSSTPITIATDANDVGSDDLRFRWWIDRVGPGAPPDLLEWFVASTDALQPVIAIGDADPIRSPSVDPSVSLMPAGVLDRTMATVTSDFVVAAAHPCLYGVSVDVADDDGASGGVEHLAVIVQRDRGDDLGRTRNFEALVERIEDGVITEAQVGCYLDMAGHLSAVFVGASELDGSVATPWSAPNGVVDITPLDGAVPWLFTADMARTGTRLEQAQRRLDRSLLAALFNLADGAFAWDTELEAGTPFWQTIAEVEAIRLDPGATAREVDAARRRLWQIGLG